MHLLKPITLALAAGTLLVACQEPCPEPEEVWQHDVMSVSPDIDANIALVEGYLAALTAADEAGIRAALAPDFWGHNTFVPADSSQADEIVANWLKNDTTRSDQKITRVAASCERVAEGNRFAGDWVHYWGTYSGTNIELGKSYVVPIFFNTRVEDGKMMESYVYYDRLAIFHQLGIDPPGPEGEEEEGDTAESAEE